MIKTVCFGFSNVVKIVDAFFQFLWNVIRALNIHLALSICLIWFVLANVLPESALNMSFWTVFTVLISVAIAYAIVATLYSFFKFLKERPAQKKEKKPIVVSVNEVMGEGKPVYYRVAQNPKYVMAEYPDRYELFYDDNGELKFVKVTPKPQQDENNAKKNNGDGDNKNG